MKHKTDKDEVGVSSSPLLRHIISYCSPKLEFATFNDLVLTKNTFGHHKASRRWTWHSQNGQHHSQTDYILVRKRLRSGVNIARKRSFPGADIGSDDGLLMMTFHLRLKKISKSKTQHSTLTPKTKIITNPHFADDIDGLAGEEELAKLVEHLDKAFYSLRHGDHCREDQADDKHQWHQHRD